MSPAVRLTTDHGSKLHLAAPARQQPRTFRSKFGGPVAMKTRCGVFGLPVSFNDATPQCRRCFPEDRQETKHNG